MEYKAPNQLSIFDPFVWLGIRGPESKYVTNSDISCYLRCPHHNPHPKPVPCYKPEPPGSSNSRPCPRHNSQRSPWPIFSAARGNPAELGHGPLMTLKYDECVAPPRYESSGFWGWFSDERFMGFKHGLQVAKPCGLFSSSQVHVKRFPKAPLPCRYSLDTHTQSNVYTYIHTYITLHYIALHYIIWHYITLHYVTLHCITLHYITYIHTYIYIDIHIHTYTYK